LNKNLKRLARKSALSTQAKDQNVVVIEDFTFESAKTKNFVNVLKAFGLENKKSLFVLGEANNNVYLSSRNLSKTSVITSSELSTYGVLNTSKLILLEGALEGIESNLSK
jgi:large subunit ribosomal protein L4